MPRSSSSGLQIINGVCVITNAAVLSFAYVDNSDYAIPSSHSRLYDLSSCSSLAVCLQTVRCTCMYMYW